MTTKPILIALITFQLVFSAYGQTTRNHHRMNEIINSGGYYHGLGVGPEYQEALKNAQDALTGSISVHVSSEFTQLVKQENNDLKIYSEAVIKTYSSAVLIGLQSFIVEDSPGNFKIFAYITKENVEKAFSDRKDKIRQLINLAVENEKEHRIGNALRHYYWALVLLRTLPDYNTVLYKFEGSVENALIFSLPDRIEQIFTFIKPEIRRATYDETKKRKEVELYFTYRNQAVQNLDFIYFAGDGHSSNNTVRNGRGMVNLTGEIAHNLNNLRLFIEYQYRNQSLIEPEVHRMIQETRLPTFDKSQIVIPVIPERTAPLAVSETQMVHDNLQTGSMSSATASIESARYQEKIRSILNAIRTDKHDDIKNLFTPDGLVVYNSLIKNGRVSLLEQTKPLRITTVGHETMVRSVPMMFSFEYNSRNFVEDVVFIFNSQGLISNISFALSDIAVDDIVNRSADWGSTEEKYYLIRFMEDYKTAYSLKRLDYIESIFADNALIIVGNMLKKAEVIDMDGIGGRLDNERIDYIRLSKSEYMERLKRVFSRNEFVNLHFEDNIIRRTTKPDERIFGIQINQHYYSSTYADKGYLFLMIDLNDSLNPKIYVRSWQPDLDPTFGRYGLEDFRF